MVPQTGAEAGVVCVLVSRQREDYVRGSHLERVKEAPSLFQLVPAVCLSSALKLGVKNCPGPSAVEARHGYIPLPGRPAIHAGCRDLLQYPRVDFLQLCGCLGPSVQHILQALG